MQMQIERTTTLTPQRSLSITRKPAPPPPRQDAQQVTQTGTVKVNKLEFAECAQIMEHKLRQVCGTSHEIEVVQRRCERGFFLRPKNRPDIANPVALAYSLRPLPAWASVRIIAGVFFEGFADGMNYAAVREWMLQKTVIDRYMWSLEGADLFIRPRPKHGHTFSAEMLAELENIASLLERQDKAMTAVYIEVQIPLFLNWAGK